MAASNTIILTTPLPSEDPATQLSRHSTAVTAALAGGTISTVTTGTVTIPNKSVGGGILAFLTNIFKSA